MDLLKSLLRSLVVSSPNTLTINNLNKDFYDLEGYNIPYTKHGHTSLENFLRSMPDTLIVHGTGPNAQVFPIKSSKSQHIQDLVAKQKKTRKRTGRAPRFNTPSFNRRTSTAGSRVASKYVMPDPKAIQKYFIPPTIPRNNFTHSAKPMQPKVNYADSTKTEQAFEALAISAPRKKYTSSSNFSKSSDDRNNKDFKIKITYKNVEGFSSFSESSFNSRVVEKYTKPSIYSQTKDKGVLDALSPNISRLSSCDTPCTNTVKNQKVSFALSNSHKENNNADSKVKPQLNYLQKKKIIETVSPPKPSPPFDLSKITNSSAKIENYAVDQETCQEDDAVPAYAADKSVFRLDFPEHTVRYGEKIAPYKLPDNIKCGDKLQIFISEVHNPFKFWFHINKESNYLDLLMHQIERFYTALPDDAFVIPSVCIVPGQICAALYCDIWHRGEIVSPIVDDHAKVFFMDYGTIWNVSIKKIKFLLTKYAQLPTQAFRGSLSHIKPVGLHWDFKACKCFLSLVFDVLLFAKICEINEENRVFYMILCDPFDVTNPVQINTELVRKQHALLDEEWQENRIKQAGERYHHLREDFPSFDMLESGEYPTLMEIVDLLKQGIHFERITDHVLFSPYKLSIDDYASEIARKLPFELLTTNPFRQDIVWDLFDN